MRAPGPWEYLKEIPSGLGDMGREAAIRKTADYLSIEAGSRPAFLAAARQSVKDMEQAQVKRWQGGAVEAGVVLNGGFQRTTPRLCSLNGGLGPAGHGGGIVCSSRPMCGLSSSSS
jgi:hypothetical protein